jgi:DegV family protein with EDD domain
MSMKIVADSCCDLNEELKESMNISIAPLTIELEGQAFRDDEDLDIDNFIISMRRSPEMPKTACPSPKEFINEYEGEESVFVVTLSSALSGTYKSAVLAKDLFVEEMGKKFIHVSDSFSASVGETLICIKISELIKKRARRNANC